MARQVLKGTCTFCHRELSKSGIAKHLQSCQQRIAGETKAQSHQKAQQTRVFHLIVQGLYAPMYWMHLEVTAETTSHSRRSVSSYFFTRSTFFCNPALTIF
jgi:hypothetical protein